MAIKCASNNIRALAKAVQRAAAEGQERINLAARLWSRFNPENTRWFLVPSSADQPANRHGKVFFKESKSGLPQITCGLWVEKGWGKVAGETLDKPLAEILTDSWTWHGFIDSLKRGEVAEAIRRIAQAASQSVTLKVIPAYANGDPFPFWLQSRGDDLKVIECPCREELQVIASCQRLIDLAQALGDFPNSEWIYIDCYLGVHITLAPANKWPGEYWSPGEIWHRLLSPWRVWLV